MPPHSLLWNACLVVLLWTSALAAQPATMPDAPTTQQTIDPDEAAAHGILAEHLVEIAQSLLPPPDHRVPLPVVAQAAALLEASGRLNPNEARYPRLLADAYATLDDPSREVDAWIAYRRIVPDDQIAQIRLILLYVNQLDTADKKINYLKSLLDKQSLAPEVKARVAAMTVPLLEERSHDEAVAMLEQARQFYPLPQILRAQYKALSPDAPIRQRVALLLEMLKANPAQADAIVEVAHFLSAAGMVDQAVQWYTTALTLYLANGALPAHSDYVDYISDLLQDGQGQSASQGIEQMLQLDPNDADAWFLKLTVSAGNITPETLSQARAAFSTRLKIIGSRIMQSGSATRPATGPTTAPAAEVPGTRPSDPMPDAAQVALRLKELNDPALQDAWVSALADLAWFELYYANRPQDAGQWISGLKLVLPVDSVTVRRYQGWSDLLANHPAEARQALSAIQQQDLLAALGMLRLEEQEKHATEAQALAQQILSQPRSGVLAAIVWQATKDKNVKAANPSAEELQAELQKFPVDWLSVVKAPNQFYTLRAEPVRVAHHLGDPYLARVTIQNISKQDITIGAGNDGLLQPQLWFDAALRGVAQQAFPGVAADRIMYRIVLHPQEMIVQIVRLDQGDLLQTLHQLPLGMVSVDASVLTNPIQMQGQVRAAPGGYPVRFSKIFSQNSEPLTSDVARRRFLTAMESAGTAEKIADIELLAAYIRHYAAANGDLQARNLAAQYMDVILHQRSDTLPGVGLWASYTAVGLTQGEQQQKIIDEMAATQATWESRLLALAAARVLPRESQQKLASSLENDSDPIVKAFAGATLAALAQATTEPAQSQPAQTQPTTQPTTTVPSP